jgi:predicted Zn-dependent protease
MKEKLSKHISFITILLIVPFLAGGMMTYNPATEEEEIIFVSADKERSMGRNIDEQVHKSFELPVDPLVQERIKKIGEKVAEGTDRRDIVYHFTVLNHKKDDCYNAFAAPGGYIYIFDDLVEVMENDDEIAAVLAHEMGHIEAKHSIKRLQGSLGATLLMILSSQIKTEKGTYKAANEAIGQLMSAYSRHDERQADELSVRYLKRAGFDSMGTVRSLKKMKKLRKKGPIMRYQYFKSHPYVSERIAHLRKVVKGYMDFNAYINLVSEKDEL